MNLEGEHQRLARASEGDEQAITEIVTSYGPALTRYVARIVGTALQPEDITQEAFLSAINNLGRLREPERFRHWLWSIARCSALDALRRHRSRTAGEITTAASFDARPGEEAPADLWMERQSIVERTRATVDRLPPETREVLTLRYGEQLSYEEIGVRMGLSPMQVKARLARARAKARDKLESLAADWKRLLNELP